MHAGSNRRCVTSVGWTASGHCRSCPSLPSTPGLSSIPGGFYGVDAFFVLSGFLITSLLLQRVGPDGDHPSARLLGPARPGGSCPALFLLVAFVGFVMAAFPEVLSTPHALGVALATVFDVSNWYSLTTVRPYFDLVEPALPMLHTWSLAIEEQFYFMWPLVLLAVLTAGVARRTEGVTRWTRLRQVAGLPLVPDRAWTNRQRLRLLLALACAGAVLSAVLMACVAPHGYTARAYYGTDTRAQAILVGAAIAIGLRLWRKRSGRDGFSASPRCWPWPASLGADRVVDDHVPGLHVRLPGRFPRRQPGGRRRGPVLRRGAGVARGAPARAPPAAADGAHLLRHLPLVLAGAAADQRRSGCTGGSTRSLRSASC